MPPDVKVGYVLKVFPRLSETFVVSELLAHERAGLDVEVFSLRPSVDAGVHPEHSMLRAPMTYLPSDGITVGVVLDELQAGRAVGDVRAVVEAARREHPRELFQAVRLARLVHERGIGHLHAHFANIATTVTRLAALLADVPYSVTAHAKDIFHEDVSAELLRRELGPAAAVVTVSDFNVEHLTRHRPELEGRVHRVYNGLQLDAFPYREPADRPAEIVGVGRLVEKKGFADLIDACALLARRRPVRCTIVGGGVLEDELRERVRRLGLEDHVELTGARGQDEVRRIVGDAAVLAAPCRVAADGNRDGLPTVLLEAMALGTPCVSTPVTGIPEAIVDGETGVLVPEHDAAALARALESLLDDPHRRAELSRAARRRVERFFDVDRNAAQWREAVLAAGHRRPTEALA